MTQLSLFSSKPSKSRKSKNKAVKKSSRTEKRTSHKKVAKKSSRPNVKKATKRSKSGTQRKSKTKKTSIKQPKAARKKPKAKRTTKKSTCTKARKPSRSTKRSSSVNQIKSKAKLKQKKSTSKPKSSANIKAKPSSRSAQISSKSSLKSNADNQPAKPQTLPKLTPAQKRSWNAFQLLSETGVAKSKHLESTEQVKQTLWSYLQFPHYADDMETYCKWYHHLVPNSFYRVPVRDISVMSDQKLEDQRPRKLNSKQLLSYLDCLTVIYYPDGQEKLFHANLLDANSSDDRQDNISKKASK